jgi:hypothetical protein
LKRRFPLVLLTALAAFAVPAGSAFAVAPPQASFTRPADSATISQNQTLSVDTTGVAGVVGVDFYTDNSGAPGGYLGGYTIQQSDPTAPQALPYASIGNVYSYQVAVGGWSLPSDPTDFTTPYQITFDAVLVDGTGTQIPGSMVQKTVTIDNTQNALSRGSVIPAQDSTVSGTFTLTFAPYDQNNVVTSGSYSVDSGDTTHPLTDNHNGTWSAPVDTVALGVPNGSLDIRVQFDDAAGNTVYDDIFYTVGNPQVPVFIPNTLTADKALFRTDETQLEVGDIVEAYGMQATGYPTPTIHYLWNVCSGPLNQACTGTTPGPDGTYTIKAGDVGATLTLVMSASNGVNPGAFQLVEFGVIAAAYVAPVDNGAGDGPQSGDAPQIPAPVVTPPVVTPPVVIPPVAAPPVVTPAERKAMNVAQKTVTIEKTAVVKAEKKVAAAKKKLAVALKALATGTATASEKAAVVAARAGLASRAAAEKAAAKKLVVAKKQLVVKTAAALKP